MSAFILQDAKDTGKIFARQDDVQQRKGVWKYGNHRTGMQAGPARSGELETHGPMRGEAEGRGKSYVENEVNSGVSSK